MARVAPQPKEIYLAKVKWFNCTDPRPCVILNVQQNTVTVACVSSSSLYSSMDFKIDDSHPNFGATGLDRTSYVSGLLFPSINISSLGKYLGVLVGDLVNDFDSWLN